MSVFKKIKNALSPKTIYKVNVAGALLNLILAITSIFIGLEKEYMEIFVASGFCFVVGAGANAWILRIQETKDRSSK